MEQQKLKEILKLHKKWLTEDGEEGYADLRYAGLRCANLRGACLQYADLQYADLQGADLQGAHLQGADLRGVDLRGVDLRGADLRGADLQYADLRGADLQYADLRSANLRYADLQGAYLQDAYLQDAHLQSAKNIPEVVCVETNILPEGTLIGWKKVKKTIIKLEIPKEAQRSNATDRKCRCEFAKVLEIQDMDGTLAEEQCVVNNNYIETTYEAGKMVYPDSWDDDRWNDCSHGIHFFISREEAERY